MDFPAHADCASAYAAGRPCLVSARLIADLETPVSAFLKLSAGRVGRIFLLESVEGGATRGRYSMIGLDPDIVWRAFGDRAEINRFALSDPNRFSPCAEPPLDALRALIAESRIDASEELPPMAAGVFGYLGYDMARQMEQLGAPKPDPLGAPDAMMMRPTVMVVFDAVREEIFVVTPLRPAPGVAFLAAYDHARERIDAVSVTLEGPLQHDWVAADPALSTVAPTSNTSEARFHEMVARAKDYVRAGDIFQVVLSQRFSAPFGLHPFALYRALRRVNPSPFLCYLDFGPFQIVCSSPEILVRLRDGKVTIRPIAGTRWRGKTKAEDDALAQDLLGDEKECAEHLMLLDLGRNDVGRVAEIGSVKVTEQFAIERYSHVMHIVSNVEGRLSKTHDAIDALSAGFPAGTVSGAPKLRAMEIIDELETDKRGVYGGCIGYFGASGEMDTCIILRTAMVKDGVMHVQSGAGIVYDSDPAYEQRECVNKAQALFRAAEEAVRFASRAKRGQ
ncbi:anthranilate synthase component I [Methylocella silvestris]|uniref:Anthranilate synthase component 1 n=1 Tax=Methylocella silvestris TaxID=199596 RepID=A0A2J7TDK5_METSI|nr:anthranilate synthase component I [Methylocella silvestris]PNG24829.1 anthranilate synthase component I [Methylocella silvestris]